MNGVGPRFDEVFELHGIPGNQICVAEWSDGTYYASPFTGPHMNNFSYWNTGWKVSDFFEVCEYCNGTCVHHSHDNYYWLCRNCNGSGHIQIKDAPGFDQIGLEQ